MSPLSRLARLLAVHEKVAWEFYLQVQKEFEKNPPKIPMIVECIERNRPKKLTPHGIASLLKGLDDVASNDTSVKSRQKTESEDNLTPAFGSYKRQKRKHRSGDLSGYNGRFGALGPGHDPRNYTEQIPTCPHGILKTKKCAICDPDGFAESNNSG